MAEVGNVLARGQVGVEPGAMRQHADAAAGGETVVYDIMAIDARAAGVRVQHRVQDAQGRRFAGAIRAQQAGNAAVAGAER